MKRAALLLSLNSLSLLAQELDSTTIEAEKTPKPEVMEILRPRVNINGDAITASQGTVDRAEIEHRPLSRTGEIVEFVPGFIATQHSGSGKANQYFGRGFNLDHGTDFAIYVDGMPVNIRSHGHGQGYSDLNFLIPETIDQLEYRKGAYYADSGDFSSAGTLKIKTLSLLDPGQVSLGMGDFGFVRTLVIDSLQQNNSSTLYGVERQRYAGPWEGVDEDVRKTNTILKQTFFDDQDTFSILLMASQNKWNSAEQIPLRSIISGSIDRYGIVDPSLGGNTQRYSLSGHWQHNFDAGTLTVNIYGIDYDFELFSNATYFLANQDQGDQISQSDKRKILGLSSAWETETSFLGLDIKQTFGVQGQWDQNAKTGLYRTQQRNLVATNNLHDINISSLSIYSSSTLHLVDNLKTNFSYRLDSYEFSAKNLLNHRNANDQSSFGSLKGSIIYNLTDTVESYFSMGQGFHTNDVKGILAEKISNQNSQSTPPFSRTLGSEIGLVWLPHRTINFSVNVWRLTSDSELVFIGDEGTTEPKRSSTRIGSELAVYYRPNSQWTLDLEISSASAQYNDDPNQEGIRVEGFVPLVISTGTHTEYALGFFHDLRLRHFGKRPLTSNSSIHSSATTLVNLAVGYQWGDFKAQVQLFNLLDSEDSDSEYYYESQLSDETRSYEDKHLHPVEPRSTRLHLSYRF